ncbi:MAG: hypothetical protein HZY76_11090 [Anaerolineae bacterium]|nr:MAG: hypothetical protein HZY76_11090 [Anaerolineae bacterium]
MLGQIKWYEVDAELEAQVQWALERGLHLDNLDSHVHFHSLPAAAHHRAVGHPSSRGRLAHPLRALRVDPHPAVDRRAGHPHQALPARPAGGA